MKTIVSKFGGSSVADTDGFRRVRDILTSRSVAQYVVLSAPGKRGKQDRKITDLLCAAHEGNSSALAEVCARFDQIANVLSLNDCVYLTADLSKNVQISRDFAASRGEFVCAKLFAEFANLPFVDAANLIFFDRHGRVDRKKTFEAIRKMAKHLPCAVVPGFYGSLPDGRIQTFSRGGSDVTGALLAAAFNADCYENWTDVDGLMSADPSLCSDAIVYPAVSYRQMLKIAEAGAQVLHPRCLAPVREAGVPTVLRNTFAPDLPGTYISDCVQKEVGCVCAKSGFRLVALESLSSPAASLLRELAPARYRLPGGGEALLVRGDEISQISAFGLSDKAFSAAVRRLRPLATLYENDCFRMAVPASQQNQAVRLLHNFILQERPSK